MDRNEAMLRELNLYPLWQRRNAPALAEQPAEPVPASSSGRNAADTGQPVASITETAPGTMEELTPPPSTTIEDALANLDWPELKKKVYDCTACALRAGCTQTVFGTGDEKAEWLFVGEGPGAEEDARGEPFVGQAGQLLDNMLLAIKLKRGKNVYIANIVKCRPPGNRAPTAEEIAQCLPYLQRQIALIQPKLIVALGKTAAMALLKMNDAKGSEYPPTSSNGLKRETTLGNLRGMPHDYRGIPLIITYHPAYLLRSPSEKAKAWQDLCLATGIFDKSPLQHGL
ncbi:MAG: uracil-DNA glycosylase [Gallionellaceae bacterium]|nr:uracil-DNA glycosylase [Gallionellaceae bacterium]